MKRSRTSIFLLTFGILALMILITRGESSNCNSLTPINSNQKIDGQGCPFKLVFYSYKMDENHYYCGWTADNDKFPQAPWIADIEEICVSNVSGFIPGAVARIPENAIVSSIFDDNRLISEPSLILILDSDESIETIRQILGNKVYILKYYKKYKFLLVEVPWNNIQETVSLDCVLKAHPCNAVYASLNSSTSMTNTKNVWFQIKRRQVGFGIRIPYLKTNLGSGVDIAVIDSGIDSLHRDFKGRIVNWKNMREDRFPLDGHGHGTHCSSIALGSGVSSSDFRFAGNARNAGLMPIGVLDEGGGGIISDIIDGIVCATDTNGDGDTGDHVDVISMSLGIYIGSDGTTPESIAAREAVNSGCVFVKSAGNQGLYGYNTITSPGDVGEVISVGAIDKYYEIYEKSSMGPVNDSILKPDIVAPGVDIIAARAHNSVYWDGASRDVYDTVYTNATGTSMAAPQVAGAAALLLGDRPDLSPWQIKSILMLSATPLGFSVFKEGAGLLNTEKALRTNIVTSPQSGFFRNAVMGDTISFKVYNIGKRTAYFETETYTIYSEPGIAAGSANVSPTAFYVFPGDSIHLTLTINLLLADETYQYGRIMLFLTRSSTTEDTLIIPFGLKI